MAEKLNETEARQGSRGRPVLLVLIAGVALIVIGYFVVGLIGYSTSPDGTLMEPQTLEAPSGEQTETQGDVVTPNESEPQTNDGVQVPG
ncbi:hypothetical protein SAMN06297251_102278 [Fulvimarina manganoxydans]|uniref:Uncharacterized protein n=1 Tax=Fulvimarina manganoxydans TaxID=937218 RepID=A0A1W1Z8P6_9HYPH|nr:hypothetical protein [Fulvimarina manganoxydans]MCK5931433.1 hypothetical protein [Fulvimarina manganoxydans]MEE2950395.1 hypothetical protein [Pseudomonadota bacterium]SMC44819.1 hypothetical protein SAMN06297251_102278 [Fulvimarina manganoxydans]